jgi:hypothetical protein
LGSWHQRLILQTAAHFWFFLSQRNFFSNPKLSIVFEEFTSHL